MKEQIEERLELSDIIDYAMRDWDDYIDECREEEVAPIDTFEEWIADAILKEGYRKQTWISVEEKLPKEFVSVLGYMTDAGDFPPVRECYVVGRAFFFPALNDVHPVSHWMPLPEPPKMKGGAE